MTTLHLAPVLALAAIFVQDDTPDTQGPAPEHPPLENAAFEASEVGDTPEGWGFFSATGSSVATVDTEPFEGEKCVLVDATEAKTEGDDQLFANMMQSLDAVPWRGKRLRFRAMVKTADVTSGSKVQLWFRIDREPGPGGETRIGGFDNMDDRPIDAPEWAPFEIVLDVADDAKSMILGMFVIGNGRAWIDDVTLEVVAADVEATGQATSEESEAVSRPRPQISDEVRAALATAGDAPQQSFWTWWLLLPIIAIATFFVGLWPSRSPKPPTDESIPEPAPRPGTFRTFALRFTVLYWLLYCLPGPFQSFVTGTAQGVTTVLGESNEFAGKLFEASGWVSKRHGEFESWAAHTVARTGFGIDGKLVPPNGSGDTTQGYLTILTYFALALVGAALWTALRRRTHRRDAMVDLTRSYLRYVLALALLGYGVAKTSIAYNQFPVVNEWRLARTWGETSPMGVVWAFMGSSRPYTVFAGLGEILGAVLLIWRRTSLLGAFVAIGVMTNIVMLNYCYDVPVKIYSTHLLMMGVLVAVPDARRLGALLLRGKNPEHAGTPSVWAAGRAKWLRRAVKPIVLVACFGLPLYRNAEEVWEHLTKDEPVAAEEEATPEGDASDDEGPLLTRRGYRWINEVPFNR